MLDRSTLELFDNATNKRKQIQNLAKMYMTTPERIVEFLQQNGRTIPMAGRPKKEEKNEEEAAKAADQAEEEPKKDPIVIPGAVADVLTRELDSIEKSMQELENALEIQKSRYRQISTFIKSPDGWNLSQSHEHIQTAD
jgi:preprotein translocase subunit Sss1